jgi:NAD+ synthase (glutamine-hydrolysing)
MKPIRVAAAVLNQTPLDWENNKSHIVAAIQQARKQQVHILCLPELCIPGYGCEDAFHSPGVQRLAEEVLQEIVPETKDIIVSLGVPLLYSGGRFSTACLVADQQIVGFVGKQNLANEGLHYESRWFRPWPADVVVDFVLDGRSYPFGDLVFNCGGVLVGFEICEDAWVAERPGNDLSRRGVDIILNPSASHFAFGKHSIRERFVLEGSRAFHVSYVYANLLGNEAGRAIYDGDAMIASGGRMLATGSRFSFADWQLTSATIDVDQTRMLRARDGKFELDVGSTNKRVAKVDYHFDSVDSELPKRKLPDWETGQHLKEEEFTRAVSLSLLDYLRKSRSRGFVVSLSGGADSSAVATLVAWAIRLGSAELGLGGLLNRLAYLAEIQELQSDDQVVHRLLTCVYQSTRNSSDTTRHAARDVAEALGAEFLEFDVEDVVQQYTSMVSRGVGRELTWEHDDLALQNIQARVRSPGIWMLANLRRALLLATSNRSEAAVGYATMDGDTSGGLSPIAGIDKAFLRSWLQWMEKIGPSGCDPIPALAAVNQQQPTAELRPPSAGQTDESDLMPYEILDAIERAAIRDKLMPVEVFRQLDSESTDLQQRQQLAVWIERFFQLWSRNQWKRERYAPSFHLDDENLDPKTWCRFPILSGGFRRELDELHRYVERLGAARTNQ